jgi:hypothetical protein
VIVVGVEGSRNDPSYVCHKVLDLTLVHISGPDYNIVTMLYVVAMHSQQLQSNGPGELDVYAIVQDPQECKAHLVSLRDDELRKAGILLHRRMTYYRLTGEPSDDTMVSKAVNVVLAGYEEAMETLKSVLKEHVQMPSTLEESRKRETESKEALHARNEALRLWQREQKKLGEEMHTKEARLVQAREEREGAEITAQGTENREV